MIEKAFVGLCIMGQDECLVACSKVRPVHLERSYLKDIYAEIKTGHAQDEFLDTPQLVQRLKSKHDDIEELIEDCICSTDDMLKIDEYADFLVKRYRDLQRREACGRYMKDAVKDTDTDGSYRRLMAGLERSDGLFAPMKTQESRMQAVIDRLELGHERKAKGEKDGIPWGFRQIDEVTGGMKRGIHVIGGWSSAGKSSVLTSVLISCIKSGFKPKVISLDMGEDPFIWRVASHKYEIPIGCFPTNSLTRDQIADFNRAAWWLHCGGFIIDPDCATIEEVETSIIRDRDIADIFIVDYLQKINTGSRSIEESTRQAMLGLNGLSSKIGNKPILLLSQFSNSPGEKELESGICPKPTMRQIRQYKDLERMIETAVFVWRSNQYIDSYKGEIQAGLVLAKSQNTKTGFFPVGWRPELAQFYDLEGPKQGNLYE